jgi:hypothetical protein
MDISTLTRKALSLSADEVGQLPDGIASDLASAAGLDSPDQWRLLAAPLTIALERQEES